ncbi:50S ribosomal protein L14 plastid [Bienertia sinuspersici]
MIQPQTHLNVSDNSGARDNRRYARTGDVIIAVIKETIPNMPLERLEVIRAVIIRARKEPQT